MKIASIGNIVYDVLAYTTDFPKEDGKTTYDGLITGFGGPAANAAYVLNKYGDDVDFYGLVGSDINGRIVQDEISDGCLGKRPIQVSDLITTPFSFIIISLKNKTRTINTYRSKSEKDAEKSIQIDDTPYDILYTDGKYPNKFRELKEKNPNAVTIIDAGRCNDDIVNLCKEMDYVICSKEFAEYVMSKLNMPTELNEQTCYNVMAALKEYFPNSFVVATVGSKGCYYYNEKNELTNYRYAAQNEVVDTNAAGDIFHGAFTHAYANGFPIEECIHFASKVATISTESYGGKLSCPSMEEVRKREYTRTLNKKD